MMEAGEKKLRDLTECPFCTRLIGKEAKRCPGCGMAFAAGSLRAFREHSHAKQRTLRRSVVMRFLMPIEDTVRRMQAKMARPKKGG
jgi:ribosomal protein L37AE/L43A